MGGGGEPIGALVQKKLIPRVLSDSGGHTKAPVLDLDRTGPPTLYVAPDAVCDISPGMGSGVREQKSIVTSRQPLGHTDVWAKGLEIFVGMTT